MIKNNKNAAILFGAHRWGKWNVVQKIIEFGYTPVLIKFEGEEVDDEVSNFNDYLIVYELPKFFSASELSGISSSLNRRFDQCCVIALDDYTSDVSSLLSGYFNSPSYPVESAEICRQKNKLRALWNSWAPSDERVYAGVPYLLITDYENFSFEEDLKLSFPVIFKPNSLDASIGVRLINNNSEIVAYLEFFKNELKRVRAINAANNIAINDDLLVEEQIKPKSHIGSSEFTAHYISVDGVHTFVGVCEKTIDRDTFVEVSHIFPSQRFPRALLTPLQVAVDAMLTTLVVVNCISNWEFIISDSNKIVLVEGQLRPSGDNVMDIIEFASGSNPIVAFLQKRFFNVSFNFSPKHVCAILYLTIQPKVDRIISIENTNPDDIDIKAKLFEQELKMISQWDGPRDWFSKKSFIVVRGIDLNDINKKVIEYLSNIDILGMNGPQEEKCKFSLPVATAELFNVD